MNFPDNPFISLLYAFINQPGIGGIVVSILGGGIFLATGLVLRWVTHDWEGEQVELYSYPTAALHHHDTPPD